MRLYYFAIWSDSGDATQRAERGSCGGLRSRVNAVRETTAGRSGVDMAWVQWGVVVVCGCGDDWIGYIGV